MEQTTIDTHYMTREFLESRLIENETRIAALEENLQRVTQRSVVESAERQRMRDEMHEWTIESLAENTIEELQAEEIAMICGFNLTKEFEVEVTVMYSVTVNARTEEEAKNAIYDIDFDTVSYNEDSVSYLSSSVDNIEI